MHNSALPDRTDFENVLMLNIGHFYETYECEDHFANRYNIWRHLRKLRDHEKNEDSGLRIATERIQEIFGRESQEECKYDEVSFFMQCDVSIFFLVFQIHSPGNTFLSTARPRITGLGSSKQILKEHLYIKCHNSRFN